MALLTSRPMTTRRAVLALAVTVAASTAGCLSRLSERGSSDGPSDAVEIPRIVVHNIDDVAHDVSVEIEDGDGAMAFQDRFELEPGTVEAATEPVSGAAEYSIRATTGTTVTERLADYADEDDHCVMPTIWVRNADELFIRPRRYHRCSLSDSKSGSR